MKMKMYFQDRKCFPCILVDKFHRSLIPSENRILLPGGRENSLEIIFR